MAVLVVALLRRDELHRQGVDAMASVFRGESLAKKDVTEVTTTVRAFNLDTVSVVVR